MSDPTRPPCWRLPCTHRQKWKKIQSSATAWSRFPAYPCVRICFMDCTCRRLWSHLGRPRRQLRSSRSTRYAELPIGALLHRAVGAGCQPQKLAEACPASDGGQEGYKWAESQSLRHANPSPNLTAHCITASMHQLLPWSTSTCQGPLTPANAHSTFLNFTPQLFHMPRRSSSSPWPTDEAHYMCMALTCLAAKSGDGRNGVTVGDNADGSRLSWRRKQGQRERF